MYIKLKQENIETIVMHRNVYPTVGCIAGLMSSTVVRRRSTQSDFTLTEWYHTHPHAGHHIIALEAKVRLERASCLCVHPNPHDTSVTRILFFLKDDFFFHPFPPLRLFSLILNPPLRARSVASSHLPSPLSNKARNRGREADDIICLLKIEEYPECKVVKCATMFFLFLTGKKEMYSALYRINNYTSSNFHSCGKAIPY